MKSTLGGSVVDDEGGGTGTQCLLGAGRRAGRADRKERAAEGLAAIGLELGWTPKGPSAYWDAWMHAPCSKHFGTVGERDNERILPSHISWGRAPMLRRASLSYSCFPLLARPALIRPLAVEQESEDMWSV
ncbi:hypothetical protein N8I77_011763 [Diaporthe amygdali]|uniref:Uncharacterized protein n=1 Tax=Phomopsis amygdali TaxID=1214568 RepID=A0AAD9S3K2_PHOAM|nr:hypothetical protein N8I77_011763 [Diaporthe amygdali]